MKDGASIQLHDLNCEAQFSIALYDSTWHQGVIGIIASRIKDKYHRPVIVFAKSEEGILKGSGRSIQSLHLRDALDLISKKDPSILITFGGHAMAAGLTLARDRLDTTCLGNAIALPHARTEHVRQIVLAVGRSHAGIPFDANGEIVKLFFVLGTPKSKPGDYLAVVSALCKLLRDSADRATFLAAETPEAFIAALAAVEKKLGL